MRQHRVRLKPQHLIILEEALWQYITDEISQYTEEELKTLQNPKLDMAIELYDRIQLLRLGFRPKGGRPRKPNPKTKSKETLSSKNKAKTNK